jgi:hypothetical protein
MARMRYVKEIDEINALKDILDCIIAGSRHVKGTLEFELSDRDVILNINCGTKRKYIKKKGLLDNANY